MNSHKAFKALTCVVNHQLCPQMKELMKENVELKKRLEKASETYRTGGTDHIYCETCEEWTTDFGDYSKQLKICMECMGEDYLYCDGCDKMREIDVEIVDWACDCSIKNSTTASGAVCNDCCKCNRGKKVRMEEMGYERTLHLYRDGC